MFELAVTRRFAAAHQLRGYKGKCENLHGHTYRVDVFVRAEKLNDLGLAVDFKELKAKIDDLLELYDHQFVNQVPPFDRINPSAENMARVFYEEIEKRLPPGVAISRVTVWESEDAAATYLVS
ncbi:MAG TPA: 6-carboxytetrahydropterin synthase QueD [bacterium]|nr:6-carboxytetrahydropterin synthase QueD [bacterium]